jgi:hypothetical protein
MIPSITQKVLLYAFKVTQLFATNLLSIRYSFVKCAGQVHNRNRQAKELAAKERFGKKIIYK